MKLHVATLASFAIAAAWQPLSFAQPARGGDDVGLVTITALENTLESVIARAEPSIVAVGRRPPKANPPLAIQITDVFGELRNTAPGSNDPITVAAGVIIDPAGLVLTEYLAAREGDRHTITTIDGTTYAATVKGADPRSALAVLAIEPKTANKPRGEASVSASQSFAAIPFGNAENLRKGQFVVAIGNPYAIASDGQPTASWGLIANMARKAPADANLNDAPGPMQDHRTTLHHLGTLIQTDAKLGWSSSGGALLNLRGELVGLTTTVATIAGHEQPAGYAIPINATMRRIIDTLKEGREVEYGLLGISFGLTPANVAAAGNGRVSIQQVYPGSPAALAGLATQDIIETVNGRPVDDIDDIQLAVSTLPPGAIAEIGYVRAGQPAKAQVTLAKLAVTGRKFISSQPPSWRGIRVDYATALDAIALAQATDSGAIDPKGCVLVSEVELNSPAWQAGVRPGMFISHVAQQRVSTPPEFHDAVKDVGQTLDIRLTTPIMPKPDDAEIE